MSDVTPPPPKSRRLGRWALNAFLPWMELKSTARRAGSITEIGKAAPPVWQALKASMEVSQSDVENPAPSADDAKALTRQSRWTAGLSVIPAILALLLALTLPTERWISTLNGALGCALVGMVALMQYAYAIRLARAARGLPTPAIHRLWRFVSLPWRPL